MAENKLKDVIRFYQSLSSDLIYEASENLNVNRDLRRKVLKIKAAKDKVKYIMDNPLLRKSFSDEIYNLIKENVLLDLYKTNYEEIINSINDGNKIYMTIFFFRWCYEYNEDGLSNDDLYFDSFIKSDLFKHILLGESINNLKLNENDKQSVNNNIEVSLNENHIRKEHKMKLLGCIEQRGTFFNFFPQFEYVDGLLKEIPFQQLKEDYPQNGGINLSHNYGKEHTFLDKEINTDIDSDAYIKNIYMIEINDNDLEENSNDSYKKKISLSNMISKGQNLKEIIRPARDYDIFKVVESESDITFASFINGNIYIKDDNNNLIEDESVALRYDRKYYGPFKVYFRTYDSKFFIKPEASETNYLIKYFDSDNMDEIIFEKRSLYRDSTSTLFIHITDKPKFKDVITEEILIEKIQDNISIDTVKSNPEEFYHLYRNSPFLSEVPKDIINKRYEKLNNVIVNSTEFKEAKHDIFETLSKQFQENIEISDKLIEESEIYKNLQLQYNKKRKEYEDAENQINELKEANETLLISMEEINKTQKVPLEEIEEKEKIIEDLEKQLNKAKEDISKYEQIEALNSELERLRRNRDKLKDEIDDAEYKVRSAIKEATESASIAFDPILANIYLKEAAKLDADEEDNEYSEKNNNIAKINPSPLCNDDLIDYIVNYVKERRNYSRNDIINIYVSIAQNFITIFSGEPGIGKTSMCNIISESLGLMDFGDKINRYVPISVERGWSSKRDLIGYFNPLTKKYDKSNIKIYDALRTLDLEKNESKYPYIILLDEANLSPIEYYWADFMRLTDRSSASDKYINIGTEKELFIPETLRFVATINTDQTTETLSPRLIDRACIIKLPETVPTQLTNNFHHSGEIITWSNFIEAFSKNTDLRPITLKAIEDIYKLFKDYGMNVSPRIQNGIKRYVEAAQSIMEDENDSNVLAREKALDFAVIQKLMPKINGDYRNYERFFNLLKQICNEYNLKMTEAAVNKIVDEQERNMGYCQYLI